MASTILIKRSTTSGAVPTTTDLQVGELAVNTADKKLYANNSGTIVELGTTPSSQAVTGNVTVGGTLGVTGATTLSSGSVTGNWTVSGALTVSTPTSDTHAASKGYVDTVDALKLNKAGDTMSGALAMGTNKITGLGDPTSEQDAATKAYVDAQVTAVLDSAPDALNTLNELAAAINDDANFATTITNLIATKLALAGGTMTGDIAMGANKVTSTATPVTADTLTRKGYVDSQDATKLNLSGGTMTGNITMGANKVTSTATPTTADDLTRKGYVDGLYQSTVDAEVSAAAALASEQAAALSASAASTSETNAAASETAAASSASAAASSASSASSSATAAANSATASAASAVQAAASAANAANTYDSFDDRYLGSKTSDPSVDNDGDPLVTGALYYNSTDGEMRIYTASGWVSASSASVETMDKFVYTATSGQTVFTGADDDGNSLYMTVGIEVVMLNGVVLKPTDDYTAASDTITLVSGAATGDILSVLAFGNFTVADTVSASNGGTFQNNVTVNGLFTSTSGLNVSSGNVGVGTTTPSSMLHLSSTAPTLQLSETDASTENYIQASGGDLRFFADDGNTSASTVMGFHIDGSERMRIDSAGNVGIGTTSPESFANFVTLEVTGDTSTAGGVYQSSTSDGGVKLRMFTSNNGGFVGTPTNHALIFDTNATERMRIESSGNVIFKNAYQETVYALSGTTPDINPANGTIQTWAVSGASTPTATFASGQSLTLMVVDSGSAGVTWPSVVWVGGSAPTLATSGYTVMTLWKVGSTLYGSATGDVA